MRWLNYLTFLIITLIISGTIEYFFPGYWSAVCFACFSLVFFAWQKRYYARIQEWAEKPSTPPSPSLGSYEDIINTLYKHIRKKDLDLNNVRELSAKIIAAANALPHSAIILDDKFQIQWCNKESRQMLGIQLETDRGYNIFNLIRNPEFFDYAQRQDWDEKVLVTKNINGETRTLQFQLMHQARTGMLLLCRDVTHLKIMETTQKDFVANVSHEIRTPLTVLIGFLETMRTMPSEALSQEQRDYYHDLMFDQAIRMKNIVADLLTLSTLEATDVKEPDLVDFTTIIKSAIEQAKVLSNEQHEFIDELDSDLKIQGQKNELVSLATNLLTNAVRYSPEAGTITIKWFLNENQEPVFMVKDTGIGIAQEDIPRLTERFYRVDKSRSRASGGTGLGLAISKYIIIRHNAQLHIESKPKQGSTFSVTFPSDSIRHEREQA